MSTAYEILGSGPTKYGTLIVNKKHRYISATHFSYHAGSDTAVVRLPDGKRVEATADPALIREARKLGYLHDDAIAVRLMNRDRLHFMAVIAETVRGMPGSPCLRLQVDGGEMGDQHRLELAELVVTIRQVNLSMMSAANAGLYSVPEEVIRAWHFNRKDL